MAQPRSPEDIFADFLQRRSGLLQALTDDAEDFFDQCDPNSENLVAYLGRDTGILQGHSDGTWSVALPAEEVPPELPEPCLGINFARDGMVMKDWLALVAVHSDAWLISVAFYYGAKLDNASRLKLFRSINTMSTLYEIITGRASRPNKINSHSKRRRADTVQQGNGAGEAQAADAPLPTGRLLTYADITPALKGRQAELYWPDDKMWYLIEVYAINIRSRIAKIQYTSGEFEDLDLDEIIREGHMSLICQ